MSSRKNSTKGKTTRVHPCSLLLWGDHFDEVAAAVFTITLRQMGLCVKIVGLNGMVAAGHHRLGLYADLDLRQVGPFVNNMLCIILPCSQTNFKRFDADPLLQELFAMAAERQVKIIVYDDTVIKNSTLHTLGIASEDVAAYDQTDLLTFAKEMAVDLLYLEQSLERPAPVTLRQSTD